MTVLPISSSITPSAVPTGVQSALACCQLLLQLSQSSSPDIAEQVTDLDLRQALKSYGQLAGADLRLGRLPWTKLKPQSLPLVLRTREGHFVLVARLSDTQALIQLPCASAPQVIERTQLAEQWSGEVIRLYQGGLRFDLSWFMPQLLRHRRILGEVVLCSLLLQVLALATPLFFQAVMDKVMVHRALSTLDVLVVTLVVVGLFEVLLKGLREYLSAHTANRIDIGLGVKLFRHLLGLPLLYFKQRQVGAIITRVQELDSIREFLTGSLLTLCIDVAFTLVFFAVMAWISWPLTLLVMATLPLYFLLAWISTGPLEKRIERQFQSAARNSAFLNESVSSAETIKSLAVEPRMQRRWEAQTAEMVDAGFASQTLGSAISQTVTLLQKTTAVAVICWGASKVVGLEMTIGQLIAFNMMLSHVSQPLAKLIEVWQQFVQVRVSVDKLGDMLNLPVEQQNQQYPVQALHGEIRIERLAFRYRPELALVLNGLDLHIEAGQTLGIVGPSGSGKSTLTRLLQKLYTPDAGRILIDGMPLQTLEPAWLRSQIGVVLQENYLFNRSVRQNIALRHPTASLESVIEAARLAGAHEFILQLPLGYDTVLAEAGSSLSGGQRQRVAIARALMGDPKILIFDEATSALDDESQTLIQDNMARIAEGRTVIIIAHRLSAVRQCQRIIALEQGQISESGSHLELLANGGCYARLWALQQALLKETE
ncbi:type I secretion system permease/ATPase [Pseudomonas chlororaphis subsp. aurantiaca]|uniref:peptidase domain-containing ABC transporter n=1 Tax=Pseudomonas chlororaphis TaxID=587753 RepID=UPI0027DD5095|nr:type I secretion system permease/ATPase [Pseudomonas chlororaphis]WMI97576.1 type I secretion system permease/ATPase [Pseudomonas chlororaphis subsp. aurantiaca]